MYRLCLLYIYRKRKLFRLVLKLLVASTSPGHHRIFLVSASLGFLQSEMEKKSDDFTHELKNVYQNSLWKKYVLNYTQVGATHIHNHKDINTEFFLPKDKDPDTQKQSSMDTSSYLCGDFISLRVRTLKHVKGQQEHCFIELMNITFPITLIRCSPN